MLKEESRTLRRDDFKPKSNEMQAAAMNVQLGHEKRFYVLNFHNKLLNLCTHAYQFNNIVAAIVSRPYQLSMLARNGIFRISEFI